MIVGGNPINSMRVDCVEWAIYRAYLGRSPSWDSGWFGKFFGNKGFRHSSEETKDYLSRIVMEGYPLELNEQIYVVRGKIALEFILMDKKIEIEDVFGTEVRYHKLSLGYNGGQEKKTFL